MKYKVNDRVRIKSLDWYNKNKDEYGNIDVSHDFTFYADRSKYCGKVFTIDEVFDNCYTVKEDNHEYYWADEMIEGLVEEEEIEFTEEDKYWCDIMSESDPTTYVLPQGYQFKDENGNIINATKIVLEKKKKEYPKTFRECQECLGEDVPPMEEPDSKTHRRRQVHLLEVLLICRDAYWKIAGEEMGLGKPWEPDWEGEGWYVIVNHRGDIVTDIQWHANAILAFPTEEMQVAFYENFKELINECKELL